MKQLAGLFVMVFSLVAAQAQESPQVRVFQSKNGATVKDGNYTFTGIDGSELTGTFKGGVPVGDVDLNYFKKGRYQGPLVNGMYEGLGYLKQKDGSQYEGYFKAGLFDGKGIMLTSDGEHYEGSWKVGMRDGQGTSKDPDGDTYVGAWRNGKRDGVGTQKFVTGGNYKGAWMQNKRHGPGIKTYALGGSLEGIFTEDKLNGPVTVIYGRTGRRQIVEFKDNLAVSPESPLVAKKEKHGVRNGYGQSTVENLPVPSDLPYAKLSLEQKRAYKRGNYGPMEDEDEPPFPVDGLQQIFLAIAKAQSKVLVDQDLTLILNIDSTGTPTDVTTSGSSSEIKELASHIANVVMREKFKPAVCGGKPCAMPVYFNLAFKTKK
jgi:hypothetical protein